MMNFKSSFFLILIFSIFITSCGGGDDESTSKKEGSSNTYKPYNITILLDLSDRDLSNNHPHPTTDIPIKHDTMAIRLVLNSLENTFRTLKIDDKVTVECVYQDNANYSGFFSDNYSKFKIDMDEVFNDLKKQGKGGALSIPKRKKEFEKRANILIEGVSDLENIALKNTNPTGGDITKFMKEKLSYYFKKDYENVLVILTDGDEAFNADIQSNRSEILLSGNFNGIKILMLGINAPNLSRNTHKIEEIRKNWISKFKPIGIEEGDIDFNELNDVNLIDKKIQQFIK